MLLLLQDRLINTDHLIDAKLQTENHLVLTMNGTSDNGSGYTIVLNNKEAQSVWRELCRDAKRVIAS